MSTVLRRRLKLSGKQAEPGLPERACLRLEHSDGLVSCRVSGRTMVLEYRPLQVGLEHLLQVLHELGVALDDSWLQRCRRAWYQYQDDAVCENAGAPPPACCNKPPRKSG